MKAYDQNTAPPAGKPRPPARPKPVAGAMTVVIEGTELPGRSCQPEPDGTVHRNIHVALATTAKGIAEGQPWLTVPLKPGLAAEPFPGDAQQARWEVTVTVRGSTGDGYDFTGPSVGGDRTDRHLGLVWGDVPGDGTLQLFRAAKLRLVDVPPGLITDAMRPGHRLVARVRLTDDRGNPGLRPPAPLAPHLVRRAGLTAAPARFRCDALSSCRFRRHRRRFPRRLTALSRAREMPKGFSTRRHTTSMSDLVQCPASRLAGPAKWWPLWR